MTTIIDFTARVRAALRGEVEATVTQRESVCRTTGIAQVSYTVQFDALNFQCSTMSKAAFDRFVATGASRDVEMIHGYARVGLTYNGDGGEAFLSDGWTWEQHEQAVLLVNA